MLHCHLQVNKEIMAILSPADGVAASVADSSNALGVCPVSPPTSAVPSSMFMISSASDRSDMENVYVWCVGVSTVNKSQSKAAQLSPHE